MSYTRWHTTWVNLPSQTTSANAGFLQHVEDTFVLQDGRLTTLEASGGAGAGTTPDATNSSKGVIQLSGGLGGTATAPTVQPDSTVQKIEVANAGLLVGTRKRVNLIQGSNVTLTAADNIASNQVDVTIAAATSGSAGIPASTITTKGDLIAANASGAPTRLAASTNGSYLTVTVGSITGVDLQWVSPTYTKIVQGATNYSRPTLKLLGSGVTVADNAGTSTTEVTIPGGLASTLISQPGDLVVGGASGIPTTLPTAFFDGQVLTSRGALAQRMDWETPPASYQQIQINGGAYLAQEPNINFIGKCVGAVDNSGLTRSDVTISELASTAPDNSLLGWTYPTWGVVSLFQLSAGQVYLCKIKTPFSVTVTKVLWFLNAIAVTPTASSNWLAIYDSNGNKLATSSASLDTSSASTNSSLITTTIASTVLPTPFVWVAFLFNATTTPKLGATVTTYSNVVNAGLANTAYNFAVQLTGQTTLPSSLTLASNNPGFGMWAAVQ